MGTDVVPLLETRLVWSTTLVAFRDDFTGCLAAIVVGGDVAVVVGADDSGATTAFFDRVGFGSPNGPRGSMSSSSSFSR